MNQYVSVGGRMETIEDYVIFCEVLRYGKDITSPLSQIPNLLCLIKLPFSTAIYLMMTAAQKVVIFVLGK